MRNIANVPNDHIISSFDIKGSTEQRQVLSANSNEEEYLKVIFFLYYCTKNLF